MLSFLTQWINLRKIIIFSLYWCYEFKGTGNSETVLDRKIADKRIYPAIDITKSGTRREELLFDKNDLQKMNVLRRIIAPMGTMDAIEFISSKLKDTKNNAEFFNSMNKPA